MSSVDVQLWRSFAGDFFWPSQFTMGFHHPDGRISVGVASIDSIDHGGNRQVFSIVAGILLMGNVDFKEVDNTTPTRLYSFFSSLCQRWFHHHHHHHHHHQNSNDETTSQQKANILVFWNTFDLDVFFQKNSTSRLISDILGHPLDIPYRLGPQEGEAAKLSDDSDASPIKKAKRKNGFSKFFGFSSHGNLTEVQSSTKRRLATPSVGRICWTFRDLLFWTTLMVQWKMNKISKMIVSLNILRVSLHWTMIRWERLGTGYLLLQFCKLYPFVILKWIIYHLWCSSGCFFKHETWVERASPNNSTNMSSWNNHHITEYHEYVIYFMSLSLFSQKMRPFSRFSCLSSSLFFPDLRFTFPRVVQLSRRPRFWA